jgi:hypothetical protein
MTTMDLMAILTLVSIVATVLYVAWRKFIWAHPKKWIVTGKSPAGFDVAMGIISRFTPGLKQAGYIEWVDGPFMVTEINKLAAGVLSGTDPMRIKLMYVENVEETALAHEMDHAWRVATTGDCPEPADDKMVAAYINEVNARIARALGR